MGPSLRQWCMLHLLLLQLAITQLWPLHQRPNFPSMALGAAVLGDLRSYLGVGISQAFTCPIGHLGCEDMDRSVAWGRAVGAGA